MKSRKSRVLPERAALLRGSKVPRALMRHAVTGMKRALNQQVKDKSALWEEAQKYASAFYGPTPKSTGRRRGETAQAVAGLRTFTEKLAKRKLVSPAVRPWQSAIQAGQYIVSIGPPYDDLGEGTSVLKGNPAALASVDATAGQMNVSVFSDFQNPSEAWATVGLFAAFTPPFAGILQASSSLPFSFSRWVNALQDFGGALSEAIVVFLVLQERNNFPVSNSDRHQLWRDLESNQLDFDFGSQTLGVSAQLDVDISGPVLVSVSCTVHARALGWPAPPPDAPRSLAGANLALTVPSITLDLHWTPVIAP